MLLGIGTDIVVVEDLRARMERTPGFRRRVFVPSEIEYCDKMADPAQHYAARFSAKEAVMKALGTGWGQGVAFSDIVVFHDDGGVPGVALKGGAADRLEDAGGGRIWLTLTHAGGLAVAVAVIEKRAEP